MQAQQPESPKDAEFDELFAGTVFEPGPKTITPGQLLLPVSASIAVHVCLLFLLRQLTPGTDQVANDIEVQPPSIQISFRPRATPPRETEPQAVEQAEPNMPEPIVHETPAPATEELPVQTPADQTAEETDTEPPSQAPRLLAPVLLDVRELIQSRTQSDEISRIYNNINCDERQRRSDLIDCGDEDPSAQYNFVAAEQNATADFFAELNLPPQDTSIQPTDRTSGDARTRASQQHMTGNLGANPLIRSVMGQP